MAGKGQLTGMRGVYLVAAELAKRGYIASPTSRSAAGADLLVTDASMKRAFSVQVKTNGKAARFWLVGKHAGAVASNAYVYVFVNIKPKRTGPDEIDYFVVPSKSVKKHVIYGKAKSTGSEWYTFWCKDAERFRDGWSVFDGSTRRRPLPILAS